MSGGESFAYALRSFLRTLEERGLDQPREITVSPKAYERIRSEASRYQFIGDADPTLMIHGVKIVPPRAESVLLELAVYLGVERHEVIDTVRERQCAFGDCWLERVE